MRYSEAIANLCLMLKFKKTLTTQYGRCSAEQVESSVKQFLQKQRTLESIIWDCDPQSIAESYEDASASVSQSVYDQSMIDTFTSSLKEGFNHG